MSDRRHFNLRIHSVLLSFVFVLSVVSLMPSVARATHCAGPVTPAQDLLCIAEDLVATATPIVAGIALLVFFWGLAKFILNAGIPDQRKEGQQVMIWGIVALFVLFSIWGIVSFIQLTLGVDDSAINGPAQHIPIFNTM
jgi:hypothetical protein